MAECRQPRFMVDGCYLASANCVSGAPSGRTLARRVRRGDERVIARFRPHRGRRQFQSNSGLQ